MTDSPFTDEMLNNIKEHPALWVDPDLGPVAYKDDDKTLPIGLLVENRECDQKKDCDPFILIDEKTYESMAAGVTMHDALTNWAGKELKRREKEA